MKAVLKVAVYDNKLEPLAIMPLPDRALLAHGDTLEMPIYPRIKGEPDITKEVVRDRLFSIVRFEVHIVNIGGNKIVFLSCQDTESSKLIEDFYC